MSAAPHTPENPLTNHEYDGIHEYDNPTPGWWWGIFVGTIVFSALYVIFWHGSMFGWTVQESWEGDQKAEFVRIFGSVGQLKHDEETLLTQMHNEKFMVIARGTFLGNCAACHSTDGGGGIGVNLCDDHYKSVTKIEDIFKVITEGANNGAMPAWNNRLSENERVILAAYVASLRGTTPGAPRAKEGNVIPPWPPAPKKTEGAGGSGK